MKMIKSHIIYSFLSAVDEAKEIYSKHIGGGNELSAYLKYIESHLYEWGKWGRRGRPKLGARPPDTFSMIGKAPDEPMIDEFDAELMDKIVSRLKVCDPELFAVAKLHFYKGLSIPETAREIRKGVTITKSYKNTVVAFVAGSLPDLY